MRVPRFAVRPVMLAVLLLLTGVVAQVMPAAAAVRAGSAGPAASFAASGDLSDVAATSASNAWAVGSTSSGTLIVRWNGTVWKRVPSPGSAGSVLYGVAATSSRDAWAVGCTDCSGSGVSKTLILRWNGSAWKQAPSPSLAGSLSSVAATSASNVWAVGSTSKGRTLIERWNGTAWKRVSRPEPGIQRHPRRRGRELRGQRLGSRHLLPARQQSRWRQPRCELRLYCRGKRQSTRGGTDDVRTFAGASRGRGFTAMQFNFVISSNERAVRLWQDCGFAIVGTLPGAFAHPIRGLIDAYVMYRSL